MTDTTEIKNDIKGMEPDNSSDAQNIKSIKASLEEFESTQNNINEIKKHINSIIDAIAQNRSMFTRAAQFWGERPLWQKIGIGLLVTLPTLILGIVFNIVLFYTACVVTLASYVTSSYILDNHNEHDEKITAQLKDGMVDLANALEHVIQSLDTLRSDLSNEIEVLHKENERLASKITQLCAQVNLVSEQGVKLKKTEQELLAIKIELEQKTGSLTKTVEEQKELLQINHDELEQIRQNMDKNHEDLSKTIVELDQVRQELGLEITKVNKISTTLQNHIKEMSEAVIMDDTQRSAFQEKLEVFIKNKEASFQKIAERIFQTERELSLVKDELNRNNRRNQELLERQEQQIALIEHSAAQHASRQESLQKSAKTLKRISFYAHDENAHTALIGDVHTPTITA